MRAALSLLVSALLAGCATGAGGLTAFEAEQLERRERGIAASPLRVHDEATLRRIATLLARIDPAAAVRVYVVQHEAPQAEVIGGQVLLVRSGLLDAAASDDELAFVLAHEWAHVVLGHVEARRRADWQPLAAEIAADAWARARLSRIGLRPGAGEALLGRLRDRVPPEERRLVHDRLEALRSRPADAGR